MPRIKFSEKDLLRGKILPPAWYLVNIENVGEGSPAKTGESTNYPMEASVICDADTGSEEFKGVPVYWNFNSKFLSAVRNFLDCFGVKVDSTSEYELRNAIGKQIEMFVETGEWQGRMKNEVKHKYRPHHKD